MNACFRIALPIALVALSSQRAPSQATASAEAEVGADAVVGPFAVLSPGASVPGGTITGPFYAVGVPDED